MFIVGVGGHERVSEMPDSMGERGPGCRRSPEDDPLGGTTRNKSFPSRFRRVDKEVGVFATTVSGEGNEESDEGGRAIAPLEAVRDAEGGAGRTGE